MDLLIYLLKSSLLIVVFFLIYYFLLQKDTNYNLKRNYLILSLLSSIILPQITLTKTVFINASQDIVKQNSELSSVTNTLIDQPETLWLNWQDALLYAYLIVAGCLLVYYAYKYVKLNRLIAKTDYKLIHNTKTHIIDESIAPFSFLNHIVVSEKDFESEKFDMILTHEREHIRQYHYIDILIMNLFCIIFWFNPIIWLYKRLAVQNLENQVDRTCIEKLDDKKDYQYLLLNAILPATEYPIIKTNIFQPSIKQRIMMMNKPKTKKLNFLKTLIVLPFLAVFFMSFQTELAYKIQADDNENLTQNIADSIKPKYDRLIVKITKDADRKYLENIKEILSNEYQINLQYANVVFEDDQLVSLTVNVNANDEFTGSASFTKPLSGLYFYRDYSDNAKNAFGLGSFPIPSDIFSKKEKNAEKSTKIVISPSMKENNSQKTVVREVSYKAKTSNTAKGISSKKLNAVKNFIINDKNYSSTNLSEKMIIVKAYKFIDDKTLKIKGDLLEKGDVRNYFQNRMTKSKDSSIKNLQAITFLKNNKAIFMDIDQFKASETKPNDN